MEQIATNEQWNGFISLLRQRGKGHHAAELEKGAMTFTRDGVRYSAPAGWVKQQGTVLAAAVGLPVMPASDMRSLVRGKDDDDEEEERAPAPWVAPSRPVEIVVPMPAAAPADAGDELAARALDMTRAGCGAAWLEDRRRERERAAQAKAPPPPPDDGALAAAAMRGEVI